MLALLFRADAERDDCGLAGPASRFDVIGCECAIGGAHLLASFFPTVQSGFAHCSPTHET